LIETEMDEIAGCIDTVLAAIGTEGEGAALDAVKQRVAALTSRHPLPYTM
jgi:glycine hydroxymethyltransferase